jgi:hypothetical protein
LSASGFLLQHSTPPLAAISLTSTYLSRARGLYHLHIRQFPKLPSNQTLRDTKPVSSPTSRRFLNQQFTTASHPIYRPELRKELRENSRYGTPYMPPTSPTSCKPLTITHPPKSKSKMPSSIKSSRSSLFSSPSTRNSMTSTSRTMRRETYNWGRAESVKEGKKRKEGESAEKNVKTGLLLALGVAGAVTLG